MPAPTTETFARLKKLVAITDADKRPTKPITEVFTGRQLATIPVGTAEDALAAIDRARAAQRPWALRTPEQRAEIFYRYHDLVLSNRDALMDLAQAETGKSRSAALEEVLDIAMTARYYARTGPKTLKPQRVAGMIPGATKTVVRHQPKGVVGVVSPWNYPMTLAVSDAVAALMGGNAVVIKPDSLTPYCALACAELLYRAGLPKELFAVVPGPGSVVGTALVENTEYLMFTGSTATGRLLGEQAGRRLIGYSAELGGKNALIIAKGAKMSRVVDAATRACFSNSGQLCISIERIYVERAIAEEFTQAFAKRVQQMTISAKYDFGVEMGSLISTAQIEGVTKHLNDALSKGATVVAGGKARPDLGPLFFEPTVLTGVTDEMECAAAETFGPLVSIYPVDSIDEAIEKANDTEYGLNSSVWAATPAAGEAIAQRLRSGTVNVNEGYAPAWGSTAAPMGGMGISGVGRRHGPEGLLKYMEPQTIATQRLTGMAGPSWMPAKTWSKALPIAIKAMKYLPGR